MTHTILRIIPVLIIVMMGSEGSSRFGALLADEGSHLLRATTQALSTHKGFKQDDNLGECMQQRSMSIATGPASSDGVLSPAHPIDKEWPTWKLTPYFIHQRVVLREITKDKGLQDDPEEKIRKFELQVATRLSYRQLQHIIKRSLHLYQPLKLTKQDGTEHNFVAWFGAHTIPVDAEETLREEVIKAEEKKRLDDREKAEEDLKKSQREKAKPLLDDIKKARQECMKHGITGLPKDSAVYSVGDAYLDEIDIFDRLKDQEEAIEGFLKEFYNSVTGSRIDALYYTFFIELDDVDVEKLSPDDKDKYDKAAKMITMIHNKINRAIAIYRPPYKLPPLATILPASELSSSPGDQPRQHPVEKDPKDPSQENH